MGGDVSAGDGSAWLATGDTVVFASVLGPTTARAAAEAETITGASVQVTVSHAEGVPFGGSGGAKAAADARRLEMQRSEAELSGWLSAIFRYVVLVDAFPRCTVAITIRVLSNDGSVEAACVNAAMAALIDAGVPCRTTVAAGTVALHRRSTPTAVASPLANSDDAAAAAGESVYLTDPIADECDEAIATGTWAFCQGGGAVGSQLWTAPAATGALHVTGASWPAALEERAYRAAMNVVAFFRKSQAVE